MSGTDIAAIITGLAALATALGLGTRVARKSADASHAAASPSTATDVLIDVIAGLQVKVEKAEERARVAERLTRKLVARVIVVTAALAEHAPDVVLPPVDPDIEDLLL